ncbi:YggT family protein [Candidatus Gracilibacteria bacterium]|nr:YggT family protein [Candidatus Gracilibacteria bacterium]
MLIIDYILLVVLIFLNLIEWVIIIDIILSWAQLLGIRIQIKFIRSITTPIYTKVRKYLPTTFGPIDFSPIVIFFIIQIISSVILNLRPSLLTFF